MASTCVVWSDLGGSLVRVGRAEQEGRVGAFNYVKPYAAVAGPAIDPINLPAMGTVYRTGANQGVFGVLADAGPDSWGERVLKAIDPEAYGRADRLDILRMTSGYGTGSLLFSKDPSYKPKRERGVSRSDLGAAAEGAQTVEMSEVLSAHMRELLRAAVTSGGVHPKIQVSDPDGKEWVAKFRSVEDVVDTPRIEFATMRLARLHCGLDMAQVELSAIGQKVALLVRRFDREFGIEHYASAHALWNRERAAADALDSWASYAGMVALRQKLPGDGVTKDALELFKRMVFNMIIGNTDDHGRNHGFLMDKTGQWRLSRGFDVLPSLGGQANVHALGTGPMGAARSFENAIQGCARFGLEVPVAHKIIVDMGVSVRSHFPTMLDLSGCSGNDKAAVMARCRYPDGSL